MSNPINPTCPRCGAPLPTGATDQSCPACMMSGALAPTEAPEPADFPRDLGRYRLLGLLGSGGMGTVYDAEQLATGRRVALKMLDRQIDDPEVRQRFLREGRLAASVSHPNSLYVFGSEEIGDVPVITMEIAGGGTLEDRLRKRGPLPVKEAVDAILDVLAGLEAAFAAGVLHRDVKPSNCFLDPDGSVKIGDFGLSVSTLPREASYVTAAGVILGTPAFAPPEQLRGDELDERADLYAVGATLFALLTGRAPFEGDNVVQLIANVVERAPTPLTALRPDVPPGLARILDRCLAKDPDGRYASHAALRDALLPFSSKVPEPASMLVRVSAGWIDYLLALLPPYLALMLLVGAEKLIVRPLVERTLDSARYYFALFGFGFLYFGIAEGLFGAGLGKRLKGLRVVRPDGRAPGLLRSLLRVAIPVLAVEGTRMPLTMAFISEPEWSGLQTAMFVVTAIVCAWIPGLLALAARRANGFATLWDLASGTRVVMRLKGTPRPALRSPATQGIPSDEAKPMGPFRLERDVIPGTWVVAVDPILRRRIWLLRRGARGPSCERRKVARPGRPRWLQEVEAGGATWDAFEAVEGRPFAEVIANGTRVRWAILRHWLHDLATELWAAVGDQSLPGEASLDHVWISAEGRAMLLDEPWPVAGAAAARIPVCDVAGQQRFLGAVAACVEATGLPLHARPLLRNLAQRRFEKLSFFTGTLRGLLERPADVSRGIRAGSNFMLPLYAWVAVVVGRYHDKPWDDPVGILLVSVLVVLGAVALLDLLGLPFRGTASHATFRLAVVDARGERASRGRLLARWAIVWLPLLVPAVLVVQEVARGPALVLLLLWTWAAIHAAIHPHRGLHDRLADTWIVRG